MKYQHIVQAEFVDRPNRFIAHVKLPRSTPRVGAVVRDGKKAVHRAAEAMTDGKETAPLAEVLANEMHEAETVTVHVKNTGRCRELLVPGATVYLEKTTNPNRSTAYDLVAVEKGERLINMDSQAPNKVVEEWLWKKELFPDLILVRPETKFGNSRFDFYAETAGDEGLGTAAEKIFIEVKGVTLEEDGVVRFPDAPSDRAVKHVEELVEAGRAGYRVLVIFVIQMAHVKYFTPNVRTHPEFAQALQRAVQEGVEILAYDCRVTRDSMEVKAPVEVRLQEN